MWPGILAFIKQQALGCLMLGVTRDRVCQRECACACFHARTCSLHMAAYVGGEVTDGL